MERESRGKALKSRGPQGPSERKEIETVLEEGMKTRTEERRETKNAAIWKIRKEGSGVCSIQNKKKYRGKSREREG